jgi:hypothetical protein
VTTSLGRLAAIILTAAAVVALLVMPLSAEIYKWVDENGVTHFSDRMPEGADEGKAETVDPSKSGSVTVLEGEGAGYSPLNYIKKLLTFGQDSTANKTNSVIIYTTPT